MAKEEAARKTATVKISSDVLMSWSMELIMWSGVAREM